jgi:hypothetical protein
MNQNPFSAITQTLSNIPSRRDVLRSLVGAGLGLGTLRLSDAEAAKKKKGKKRKRKKQPQTPPVAMPPFEPAPLVFNQYGCIDVGQPCRGDSSLCCSGICEGAAPTAGQPDASRCVAHDTGACAAASNICTTGAEGFCNPSNLNSHCTMTTGKAGFCGDFSKGALNLCRDCSRDTDCEAEFGPGAACVVYDGLCATYCPSSGGTACMPAGI